MNRITKFIAISAFSLAVLALPSVASAQYGGYGGYGNGGYGNGRYNRDIRGTLQSLKQKAGNFERMTNRVNDRDDDRWGNRNGGWGNNGGYGGYGNGGNGNRGGDIGRIEDLADNFKRATDKLLDEYGRGRDLRGSENEARRVLDLASQIDNEMYRTRNRNLQNQWNQMRMELNVVANTYGNYGGYNDRNRNGDWRNRIPFPLPF